MDIIELSPMDASEWNPTTPSTSFGSGIELLMNEAEEVIEDVQVLPRKWIRSQKSLNFSSSEVERFVSNDRR